MFTSMTARGSALALLVFGAVACSNEATGVYTPITAGMSQVATNDTAVGTPQENNTAPGYFRGVVRGYTPGPGTDTLGTAVLLADVAVLAYPLTGWSGNDPVVGTLAASVKTNAQGEFQLPELPAGHYLVTFTPPAGSPYRSGWTEARTTAQSGDARWWIMLPTK